MSARHAAGAGGVELKGQYGMVVERKCKSAASQNQVVVTVYASKRTTSGVHANRPGGAAQRLHRTAVGNAARACREKGMAW